MAAFRALMAVIIAFALTLAFPAAGAMKAMPSGNGVATAHSRMPDCHKAKHRAPHNCGCCDDHSKSKCPDNACGCLYKCGMETLAVIAAQAPIQVAGGAAFSALNSAEHPGLPLIPPGPPPRA